MKAEEIMRISAKVASPLTTGATPVGEIRVIPFEGGSFDGPDLRGVLLPGGSDWQRVREDGVLEIRAHYMLRTVEGENIEVISEGLRSAPADVLQRLDSGETVDPDLYYFRTFIRLTTGAGRLKHLNHRLYYGTGIRHAHEVQIVVRQIP